MCAQKSDSELRGAVERKIGRSVDDVVWHHLADIRRDYERGALEESEKDSIDYIAEVARTRMELIDQALEEREAKASGETYSPTADEADSGDSERVQSGVVEVILDEFYGVAPDSKLLLRATSAYFESIANQIADQLPEVERVREEVLNGELLSHEQAVALLNSYAARFMSPELLFEYGIPLTSHAAKIETPYERVAPEHRIDHRVALRIEPPEELVLSLRYAEPGAPPTAADIVRHEVQEGVLRTPYNIPLADIEVEEPEAAGPGKHIGPILVANLSTPQRPSEVWPGSLVDRIYSSARQLLSRELAEAFKWPLRRKSEPSIGQWDEHAAAEFLLTGIAPLTQPVQARVTTGQGEAIGLRRVELEVLPWVSDDDVLRIYKRAQREISKKQRARKLRSRTCEVIIFVLERRRANGHKKIPWPALFREWNLEHPKNRNFEDYRHLRACFERGCDWIEEANFSVEDDE